jgi:hypothetical protein
MTVRITNLNSRNPNTGKPASYVAHSEADCRGNTDRSVYQMACIIGDVVRAGMVIGEPVLLEIRQ